MIGHKRHKIAGGECSVQSSERGERRADIPCLRAVTHRQAVRHFNIYHIRQTSRQVRMSRNWEFCVFVLFMAKKLCGLAPLRESNSMIPNHLFRQGFRWLYVT